MKAAVLQMNSGPNRQANLKQAGRLLARAAKAGARLAVLPEHFSFMQTEGLLPKHPEALQGPLMGFLAQAAREHCMWLVGGSFSQKVPGQRRVYNICPVLDPQGRLRAAYRKVHLFDLALPGQRPYKESVHTLPGRRLVVLDTPLGRLGLSICYDLRFPELYRRLRLKGAELLAAPSAFTRQTGRDHWELLVRTRAMENQCFLLAAAQYGRHGKDRQSYGHAMIVDPWGEIMAQCPAGPGLALAEISPKRLKQVRSRLDTLPHSRLLPSSWAPKERP